MANSSSTPLWKRCLPITLIVILAIIAYLYDAPQYFSFQELKARRQLLLELVASYPLLAPLIYISLYAALAALSIPGGAFFTVVGGFLFPQPLCTLYVVSGATIGACLLFLAARFAFSAYLEEKAGPWLVKIASGLKKHPISYLLFLRLVPVFPFWLVNLAPALLGVAFFPFFLTTFLGIIPGSFVYAQAGTGLGAIFSSGEAFSLQNVFNIQMRIALVALGIIALVPILLKRLRKHD